MKISTPLHRGIAALTVGLAAIALSGCSLLGNVIGNTTNPDKTDVFTIKVGDCLNDTTTSGTVTTVPVVACKKPHDTEAFKSIIMTDDSYPGEDATTTRAQNECNDAFTDFAGITYKESKTLDVSFYYPTTDSWDGGDREILCLIFSIDKDGNEVKTTGSLKGVAR
jgi:Septum formation